MTSIHIANPEERLEAYRIAYESWGRERTLEEYLELCLQSVKRNRAECWVLCENGEVLSSLLLHPLHFWFEQQAVSGFGFGSVCTRSDARRQGRCHRLCSRVIDVEKERGARFGLLFSDLGPGYYGRMGFHSLTRDYYVCTDISGLRDSGPRIHLAELNPQHHMDFLHHQYESYHWPHSISLARSLEYWKYSLKVNDDLLFFAMEDTEGTHLGYVRYWQDENMLIPIELVTNPGLYSGLLEEVYRALAHRALRMGIAIFRGWQKPPKACLPFYRSEPRQKGWPMLWTHPDLKVDLDTLCSTLNPYGSDYF